jgi:hypothetical protein
VIILERHPVSGYELRHYRREPDDVLTRKVDVDILACPKEGAPPHPKLFIRAARIPFLACGRPLCARRSVKYLPGVLLTYRG